MINEKTIEKVKKAAKEQAVKENGISKEEAEILEKALAEAKMPVKLTDDEFKLGDYELDIRDLNDSNKAQMVFRMLALNIVYLRGISQSLIDMMRLQMISLKAQGVGDIVKATEELLNDLQNKVKAN